MNQKAQDTLKRIKRIIKNVYIAVESFPKTVGAYRIGGQVIDSITSIGANFVEAQSARSKREFVSTMGIVLKETKETIFWIEIIEELGLSKEEILAGIHKECLELSYIFTATILSARS